MIKLIFFLLLSVFTAVCSFGQTVSNVDAYQEGKNIIITYDTDKDGTVGDVYCSTDGGLTWGEPLRQVTGDVNKQVSAGSHRIVWDVLSEREKLAGENICFKVLQKVLQKPIDSKVYTAVEQMPFFPGGDNALMKYIASHLQYPPMAEEQGIQGKCIVQFVVTSTGDIGEVKIIRSLSPECDNEAKRLISTLPRFNPGQQDGRPVNAWYTLPLTFKLQK